MLITRKCVTALLLLRICPKHFWGSEDVLRGFWPTKQVRQPTQTFSLLAGGCYGNVSLVAFPASGGSSRFWLLTRDQPASRPGCLLAACTALGREGLIKVLIKTQKTSETPQKLYNTCVCVPHFSRHV